MTFSAPEILRQPPEKTVRARDRLRPSLLDRLTDEAPHQRGVTAVAPITHSQLRRQVLRDLQWLFNTVNHDASAHWQGREHVRRSVVNYGIAPLAGRRMSEIEWSDIQARLTDAILCFEPRILPQGLQVRCIADPGALDQHNILSIEIKGQLWCEPYPLEFLFRTELDLENGHIALQEAG